MIEDLAPPRNLYDCILGLRNPVRKQLTLKLLPNIIRRNPEDLVFTWKGLTDELLFSLNDKSEPALRALFVTRPALFI